MTKTLSLLVTVMVLVSMLLVIPVSAAKSNDKGPSARIAAKINGKNGEPTQEFTLKGDVYKDESENIFRLLNKERTAAGLPELAWNEGAYRTALQRAFESSEHFAHERPDGSPVSTVSSHFSGENLGTGPTGNGGAKAVMEAWMNSEGHKNNILEDQYVSVSIACIEIGDEVFWVQIFSVDPPEEIIEPL